jgi:hypothetical protein
MLRSGLSQITPSRAIPAPGRGRPIAEILRGLGSEALEAKYARQVNPVIDPALPRRTQRWLRRLVQRAARPSEKMPIEYIGPVALVCSLLGWLVTGLADQWLWGSVVAAIVSVAIRYQVTSGALARHRHRFVDPASLDITCWRPLRAAQAAIDDVVRSEVYQAGMLAHAAHAADLRRHEWEIACRLREITNLGARYADSLSAGVPGPQTAAVLHAHSRAIDIARKATTRRVTEMERYAAVVKAADVALRDWKTAQQVADRNDLYLDLVAASEADRQAVAEIMYLADQAIHTRDAFESTLNQAMLAAQPLVLPETDH